MTGRVVHCRKEPYDVFIGRPGEWGNPFKIGMDGTREEVVSKYEDWMRDRLIADTRGLRNRIAALHGKVLGCYCAPLSCHGDVLMKLAAECAA